MRRRETLEQNYQKNREEIRGKLTALYQLARQIGASTSEAAQLKKKLALEHLELLTRRRDRIDEQIRDIRLKILMHQARLDKARGAKIPDYLLESEFARDQTISAATRNLLALKNALAADQRKVAKAGHKSLGRLEARSTP